MSLYLITDDAQLFGDKLVGAIPTDPLPFAFAALADPLERVAQPVRLILLFKPRHAHGADAPVIVGEREAAGFDLVDTTVDDVSRDAAARAGMAIGVADGADYAGFAAMDRNSLLSKYRRMTDCKGPRPSCGFSLPASRYHGMTD